MRDAVIMMRGIRRGMHNAMKSRSAASCRQRGAVWHALLSIALAPLKITFTLPVIGTNGCFSPA